MQNKQKQLKSKAKANKALEEHGKNSIASNKSKKHDYDDESRELLNQKKKKKFMTFLKKGKMKY